MSVGVPSELHTARPYTDGQLRSSQRALLSLLRGFELRLDGVVLTLPRSCQRVVALLALHEQPLLRSYVAGMLWMDVSEVRASASLRSALWRLHRPEISLVGASHDRVWLAPEVGVDVRDATQAARSLIDHASPVTEGEQDELQFTADVLPDWYDDWVIVARERFRQLRLHALEELCRRLSAAGRYALAVQAGAAAVAAESLRESAHRALIGAHLAEGNLSEAIRQFDFYRQLLREELDAEPSPELRSMFDRGDWAR